VSNGLWKCDCGEIVEQSKEHDCPNAGVWHPHGFAYQIQQRITDTRTGPIVLDRSTAESLAYWLRTLPEPSRRQAPSSDSPTP
jgi:hypothetical protein